MKSQLGWLTEQGVEGVSSGAARPEACGRRSASRQEEECPGKTAVAVGAQHWVLDSIEDEKGIFMGVSRGNNR